MVMALCTYLHYWTSCSSQWAGKYWVPPGTAHWHDTGWPGWTAPVQETKMVSAVVQCATQL